MLVNTWYLKYFIEWKSNLIIICQIIEFNITLKWAIRHYTGMRRTLLRNINVCSIFHGINFRECWDCAHCSSFAWSLPVYIVGAPEEQVLWRPQGVRADSLCLLHFGTRITLQPSFPADKSPRRIKCSFKDNKKLLVRVVLWTYTFSVMDTI